MMHKKALNRLLLVLCLALAMITPAAAQQLSSVAITNGASFRVAPLSPGTWGTVFADFASIGIVTGEDNFVVPLPTMFQGVEILINGSAVPLNYVGPGQINFVVPFTTPLSTFQTPVTFVIRLNGTVRYTGTINIVEASPAFFTLGNDRAAALNQDNTLNGPENPAAPGSVVQIFATGPGPLTALPGLGEATPITDPPFSTTTGTIEVFVQADEAIVEFTGLGPGYVALWQINVRLPANLAVTEDGTVAIFVKVNGLGSVPVAIYVQANS